MQKAKQGESQKEGEQQNRIHRSFAAVHRLDKPFVHFRRPKNGRRFAPRHSLRRRCSLLNEILAPVKRDLRIGQGQAELSVFCSWEGTHFKQGTSGGSPEKIFVRTPSAQSRIFRMPSGAAGGIRRCNRPGRSFPPESPRPRPSRPGTGSGGCPGR